jgi:2-iminobutanoate/2-iminopropanoate deaminase
MERKAVQSERAPAAIGPYSQAVIAGPFVFLSGQLGIDPARSALVEGGAGEQMAQALENVRSVLEAAGSGMERVVRTTLYLQRMEDFQEVNGVYGRSFTAPYPARSTVAVARLPLGALVEVEVVALAGG